MENSLDLYSMMSALLDDDDDAKASVNIPTVEEDERFIHQLAKEETYGIAIIQAEDLSVNDFRARFNAPNRPVVIQGIVSSWKAFKGWDQEHLIERFGPVPFALYNGQTFPLQDYFGYMSGRGEDEKTPFYLFEDLSTVSPSDDKYSLLSDYVVPEYFSQDLFRAIDTSGLDDKHASDGSVKLCEGRPRYRWLLIGPSRSGTVIHQDPLGTSAWNALTSGHKRWVLLPPTLSRERLDAITLRAIEKSDEIPTTSSVAEASISVVTWFREVLPVLRDELKDDPNVDVIEYTQNPGDLIFVPAGWWHIVVNMDTTVAITENFASVEHFEQVNQALATDAPIYHRLWLDDLVKHRAQVADSVTLGSPLVLPPFQTYLKQMAGRIVRWGHWSDRETEKEWIRKIKLLYNGFRRECIRRKADRDAEKPEPRIPKILHQVWLGSAPPKDVRERRQRWVELHPDWEHRLWTDEEANSHPALWTHGGRALFDAAKGNFGKQSDILRYQILRAFGGVYVDTDFECVKRLDDLVDTGLSFFAGQSNTAVLELNNGIFGSTPLHAVAERLASGTGSDHPKHRVAAAMPQVGEFLDQRDAECTTQALENSNTQGARAMETIQSTGPGFFTTTVLDAVVADNADGVVIFPVPFFFPLANNQRAADWETWVVEETIAVHLWAQSWMKHLA